MRSLSELFARVERGERLLSSSSLIVVPEPPGKVTSAVVSFTGLVVVAAEIDPDWIYAQVPAGDLSAPLNPPFLTALSDKLGRRVNCIDAVLLAESAPGTPQIPLTLVDDADHPRVRRARRYRDEVRVWTTPGGVLILGRGLARRWEAAIEVDEDARNRGLGRQLARAARQLVPDGAPVWVQVAPGNAASLRAFLAAGYRPVGAEALLVP